jgi:hypothetical protein
MDEQGIGGWYSFTLAAEIVERRLGITWGLAQKTLLKQCERGAIRWQQRPMGGPDVSCNDLKRWLGGKLNRRHGGKRARIMAQLKVKFHGARVPEPELCPRGPLKDDIEQMDKTLGHLDEATLKTAIDEYNDTIRIDPNRFVSD